VKTHQKKKTDPPRAMRLDEGVFAVAGWRAGWRRKSVT
jgi:hypothetical protein